MFERSKPAYLFVLSLIALLGLSTPVKALESSFDSISSGLFFIHVERSLSEFLSSPPGSIEENSATPSGSNPTTKTIASQALLVLEGAHGELTDTVRRGLNEQVVVRFVSPETFYNEINAPEWSSAVFSHGEIKLTLKSAEVLGDPNVQRNLRHEYVHAVVNQLSKGRCPAWLDEGLAHLFENSKFSPDSSQQTFEFSGDGSDVTLSQLEKGFAALEKEHAAAAYRYSVGAVHKLVADYGNQRVWQFVESLGSTNTFEKVFVEYFGKTLQEFEAELS